MIKNARIDEDEKTLSEDLSYLKKYSEKGLLSEKPKNGITPVRTEKVKPFSIADLNPNN